MINRQLSADDQNDLFNNLLTLVGYGNPWAAVWFVGIEDGGDGWTATDDNIQHLEDRNPKNLPCRYYPMSKAQISAESTGYDERTGKCDGRKGTKIYRYMDYIVSHGRNRSWNPENMSLVDAHGKNTYFQMNLYPLAKPNTAYWPEGYEKLFGFSGSRQDRQRYANRVRCERFKILREYWQDEKHHPVLTICFGKTNWPDHRLLFELGEGEGRPVRDRILYYHNHRVVLAPFFNPRQLGVTDNLKPLLDYLTLDGVTW